MVLAPALRGCFRGGFAYVLFKKWTKLNPPTLTLWGHLWYISISKKATKQRNFSPRHVLNHFGNLMGISVSNIKRQISQTNKNWMKGREMNNHQTSTKQTKAQPHKKMAMSAENICAKKRLSLQIKTYEMTTQHISRHFVSGSFEKVARAVHSSCE